MASYFPLSLGSGSANSIEARLRQDDPIFGFAATLLSSHQIIVTTTKGVYSWTSAGVQELFRSGSGGIVAAAKSSDDRDLIAVADNHTVILHDNKKRMLRSYRLKGADGPLRMLKYQKEPERLFFTTSLQNAVLSYSFKEAKVLDTSCSHPSPPTVFAISPSPRLLLSASAIPPTIYLQSLDMKCSPELLIPNTSQVAVAAATFHLERPNIFAIGFADGTISIYNASSMFHADGKHQRISEVATVKKVHGIVTKASSSSNEKGNALCEFDPTTTVTDVGDRGTSIVSICFVPGSEITIISVGADGKCCVVDFTLKPSSVRTWYCGATCTCLSIIRVSPGVWTAQYDGSRSRPPSKVYTAYEVLVAIGRQDGRVLLYELDGGLLAERSFEDSAPVIDVEWLSDHVTSDGITNPPWEPLNSDFADPGFRTRAKTEPILKPPQRVLRRAIADAYALADSVDAKAATYNDEARGILDNPSTLQVESEKDVQSAIGQHYLTQTDQAINSEIKDFQPMQSPRHSLPPQIPPRPKPRKDGKSAMRNAGKLHSISRVAPENGKMTQLGMKIVEPSKEEKSKNAKAIPGYGTASYTESSVIHDFAEGQPAISLSEQTMKPNSTSSSSGEQRPLRRMSLIPSRGGSKDKTSASQGMSKSTPTEDSDDTIVSWTAGSARRHIVRPNPSDLLRKPRATHSITLGRQEDTGSHSVASDDTIIDWNLLPQTQRPFDIHEDSASATETPVPAYRCRISASRKLSTASPALGHGSLNAIPKNTSTGKAAASSKITTRRSSKQNLGHADVAALNASFEERIALLEKRVMAQSEAQTEKLVKGMAKGFEEQKVWIREMLRGRNGKEEIGGRK